MSPAENPAGRDEPQSRASRSTRSSPATSSAGATDPAKKPPQRKGRARAATGEPPQRKAEPRAMTDNGPQITVEASMVKGLARTASRIVSQASTILEEELANGIGAAKEIEGRFVNIAEMRSASPDEVVARFRRGAHEVVDIVLDLINVSTRSLNGLAQRISVGEPAGAAAPLMAAGGNAPTIALPEDIPAGGSGAVPFSLENDGDAPTGEFEFQATDLVNAEGNKILGKRVSFEPSRLTIPAHDRENVTLSIDVPKDTAPGVYSGLVLASKLERLRAVLVVSVP
jgi:hypothetical protein